MLRAVLHAQPRQTLADCVARCDRYHWVTADGRRLRVSQMETPHLVNTVRMLRRNARAASAGRQADLARASMFFQGDAALDAIHAEMAYEMTETDGEFLERTVPPYAAMLRRLARLKVDVDTYKDPRPKRPRRAIESGAPCPLDEPCNWDSYGRGQDERGGLT